jgi:CheY-specific phosphatase CheX
MNRKLEAGLYKAAVRTFEDLSLQLPNPVLNDEQHEATLRAAVGISFEGAIRGWLILRMCGEVLPDLTASMLGEDREPSETEQQDALGEVANVICGNLLPDLVGARKICHIAAPLTLDADVQKSVRDMPEPAAAVEIGLNQGRAEVMLYIDRESSLCVGEPS